MRGGLEHGRGRVRRSDRGEILAALLFSVIGALLLTEASLRLFPALMPRAAIRYLPPDEAFPPDHGPAALVYEPDLGFRPAPGQRLRYRRRWDLVAAGDVAASHAPRDATVVELVTDHQGFRNPPDLPPAEIAVVGDSFVQSVLVPYEETWTSVLARRSGRVVRNLGVAGYGPQQALRVIERFALESSPRVVVLALFEGNDVHNASLYRQYRASGLPWDAFQSERRRLSRPTERWRRLDRSRVLASLRYLDERRGDAGSTGWNPVCGEVAGERRCLAFGSVLLYRETLSREEWRAHEGWGITREVLRQARDVVRRSGADLVVATIPSKGGLYLPRLEGATSSSAFEGFVEEAAGKHGDAAETTWGERFERHRGSLSDLLGELLAGEGIPHVDLRPVLDRAAGRGRLLYFPFDSHWNADGNRLAGETVAAELARMGL